MSSISGLGGGAQGLFQFIQSLTGTSQSPSTSATTATAATGATDLLQSAMQALSSGHHHHHHGGGAGGTGGIFNQIQSAVTNALQTAQSSGTASDPNQIVENAIAQVLKSSTAATPATGSTSTSTTSQTPLTDPSGDNTTGGTSSMAQFFQSLQTAGINPQQFSQDFLNAVKDAQNGTVNMSTAFQSIPIGSTVDTLG